MTVSALAEAAAATGVVRWAEAAVGIADVLYARLRRADGRWLRSLQGDDARHLALAADYAWVLDCSTRLAELTGRELWSDRAAETARAMLDLFAPAEGGALFTTGRDADALIVRPRDLSDGAVPSATAVAAGALVRLGALRGDEAMVDAAAAMVRTVAPLLGASPMAFADVVATLSLFEERLEIVVTGERPDLLGVVRSRWLPDAVLAWGEPTSSPLWEGREPGAAYVCRHYACRVPARDPVTLEAQLALPGG
jgi:hypothetical protein